MKGGLIAGANSWVLAFVSNKNPLMIYNTLSKKKELFKPIEPGKVKIYTCGLTVNDYMHIGHARTYILWDTVVRYLKYVGYDVFHVSNVTDVSVDERFMKRTKELGISYQQLIEKFTWAYFKDREALGISRADVQPLVTQHIREIIEFIEKLLEKGYAYEAEDGVYFDVHKFKDYGKLSGVVVSALKAGGSRRVGLDEYDKAGAGDFALWKKALPDEPYWFSPWGKGRPGWHIECSTMAMKYLGQTVDIHGGGEEHIFPHHENEIAQSEALTRKPFANYWIHARHVFLNGKRMSKSKKNYILIEDAVNKYGAALVRLYLLTVHYRKRMDFDEQEILRLRAKLACLESAVHLVKVLPSQEDKGTNTSEKKLLEAIQRAKETFSNAMDNDFNTGLAVNAVLSLAKSVIQHFLKGRSINKEMAETLNAFLAGACVVLFGDLFEREVSASLDRRSQELLEFLLSIRERLRKDREYDLSDSIRMKLAEFGIEVQDTLAGPKYVVKPVVKPSRESCNSFN
jgi:cysteinyl-tRNA synthetase